MADQTRDQRPEPTHTHTHIPWEMQFEKKKNKKVMTTTMPLPQEIRQQPYVVRYHLVVHQSYPTRLVFIELSQQFLSFGLSL